MAPKATRERIRPRRPVRRPWVAPLLVALALGALAPRPAASRPMAAPATAIPATAIPAAPAALAPAPAAGMQTIGLIGGITWVSSIEYYRLMNQRVQRRFGDNSSARVLMYSIEFGEFSRNERLAEAGDWSALRRIMLDAAGRLKRGGADFIVIASNTMNSTADLIEQQIGIPVLQIADTTGEAIRRAGISKVVLLGTKFTMEAPFYRERLKRRFGIEVVTPELADRDYINRVIFDELAVERFTPEAKARFVAITERLVRESGAGGVVLGCTEIPLLIQQKDLSVPAFDTMTIHAEAAVDRALR